jgi:hypothetical protein
MKQLLLALVLIAIPVGLFAAYERLFAPPPAAIAIVQPSALGEMTDLKAIVTDTAAIIAKGDLAGAEKRITDFEGVWDDQEAALQPKAPEDWGRVDAAADGAIKSLRTAAPDATTATAALATLLATLSDPTGGGTARSGPQLVSGIAVTDASGHPIPCEEMIKTTVAGLAATKLDDAGKSGVADLKAKAIERCNADDDTHADAFSAQALAALSAN